MLFPNVGGYMLSEGKNIKNNHYSKKNKDRKLTSASRSLL